MVLLQLPVIFAYELGEMTLNEVTFFSSAMLSMSFSISVFVYLLGIKHMKLREVVKQIGLSRKMFTSKIVLIGLALFATIFMLEVVVTLIEQITGVQISTNVSMLLQNAPLWFYVFAIVVAPINEEIMFRGFFVPRLGIVISAILFAIPHITYASTYGIEVIAAFIFGLLAGYVFKKTRSLYASIIAHALVNALAVASFLV